MALLMEQTPLTASEALSGIFGSISLASWIFLLVPQLVENYRARSAAGISITFLLIWFVGDLTNLIGAIWAGLVPTVIALAAYFCLSDTALLLQCLYYNLWVNGRHAHRKSSTTGSVNEAAAPDTREDEPLLSRIDSNNSYSSTGLPGSHKRRRSTLTRITERPTPDNVLPTPGTKSKTKTVLLASLKNAGFVLAVCTIGTLGWALAYRFEIWKPQPLPSDERAQSGGAGTPLGASILGYVSAVAYLGARIPQIYKNWAEKSCEGLSLLFFLLSLLGNATYGLGILCHSLDRDYVLTNLPWLIGSLGTMAEDVTIFVQFHVYGDRSAADEGGTGEAVAS